MLEFGFKSGVCLNDERSVGGMGIVFCSRFGGLSIEFRKEARAGCGVLVKESVGVEMEDALGLGVPKIFEGGMGRRRERLENVLMNGLLFPSFKQSDRGGTN